MEFSPIHESTLGFNENGQPLSPLFPYGVTLGDATSQGADNGAIIAAANGHTNNNPGADTPANDQSNDQGTIDEAEAITSANCVGVSQCSEAAPTDKNATSSKVDFELPQ